MIEEWHLYENQYEELSQWIKDTETDMKTESDLKATLEDKTEQLEKQQVHIIYIFLQSHYVKAKRDSNTEISHI